MSTKKIVIISLTITLLLSILGGFAVFAMAENHHPSDRKQPPKTNEETGKIARVDKIEGNTLTVTFGSLGKSEDKDKTEKTNPSDSFTANSESQNLTVKDPSLLEGITDGSIVEIELDSSDSSVITKIKEVSQKSKSKSERTVARIDSINEDQVTVTLGKINRSSSTDEKSNPSENFEAGTESKTYTVKDISLLNGLKAGDIVILKVSQTDNSLLEGIKSISKSTKDKTDKSDQNDLSGDNSSKQQPTDDLKNSAM